MTTGGVKVEILVGPAPAPGGALALGDFEAAEDLSDAVSDLLSKGTAVDVALARARPPTPGVPDASMTVTEGFEAVLGAAGRHDAGSVRCFVASETARAHLAARQRSQSKDHRRYSCGGWRVVVRCGDITAVVADAVVNASNTGLRLGSGVSGALRRACGAGLQAEMDRIGGITEDGIAATGAHDLRTTSRILHVPTTSGRPPVVRRAIENVLDHCRQHRLTSVAIPALGAGTGNLDVETLADLCAAALAEIAAPEPGCTVIFVLWDDAAFLTFERVFDRAPGFLRG